ncbi:MAG TPA: carboxypeptidase regulatory-like domain-containing protein [Terracidiphilus sp.]|nr:carboxypeptidase regulatory-like domain-containing protein [Terracidiphilus sp.]
MHAFMRRVGTFPAIFLLQLAVSVAFAQSGSGTISGVISDPSGALIPGAAVTIENPVSHYSKTATTDNSGRYQFSNVPFNPYHMTVAKDGFASAAQDITVRSAVPQNMNIALQVGGATSTVTVEAAGDLIENDSTFHVDVDRDLFNKVPLESASSGLSSLVTLTTPGVTADSNGLFHGLGDHASNSFSVDGQSITDQQSKVFSNQLPSNSIQSLEVISGAPPAEYGDKTSLVIVATTRSGQGDTKPTGSIYSSYGSFGSTTGGFDLGYGGQSWGNFLEADGLNTGRFLDPPEFTVFHAKGNEQNFFDRIDYSLTPADSVHLNLNYSRSWFQNPNAFDNLNVQNVVSGGASANPVFGSVGDTDQRSKIDTFNIAPSYTRILNKNAVLNSSAWVRKDLYHYYPSANPFADLGPLQTSSIEQTRSLMNAAGHADLTYARGPNNIKIGIQYGQTFLRENNRLGVVDSTYSLSAPCVDANGNPLAGYSDPSQCPGGAAGQNTNYQAVLAPYDLTRGGTYYLFHGRTDVKELAMYVEDQIKAGNWNFNLGIRGDLYNGLAIQRQAEPRVGVAYNIKPSGTVLSVSYARTMETPFNENLVLSSLGCADPVLSPLLSCTPGVQGILSPGFRNEFHASVQQAFGKFAVVSGEYIWKYTHNAFDFSVLGNTPIFFPINWHNSKIPGLALHADIPNYHGFSAYLVASSVAARFFPPQVAGAGATVGQSGLPFRIDHDEKFNQTTHLQYAVPSDGLLRGVWSGFNWRYDSGVVAGQLPCYNVIGVNTHCTSTSITLPNGQPGVDLSVLTPGQQFQAGIICDGVRATPTSGFTSCDNAGYTSSLVQIPRPNTEDNDRNPARIAPRSLFDVSVGKNNIFHKERYKLDLDLTAINVTNKYALYNFLSTFSGTHYVTPRSMTAKLTLNF